MEFKLVNRYRNKLLAISRKYGVPSEDVFQEARTIEWRLEKYNPLYRVSYFLTACDRTTKKLVQFGLTSLEELEENNNVVFVDKKSLELWENIYIRDLTNLMREVDEVLQEIFVAKIVHQVSWDNLRKEVFPEIPHNQFWELVLQIKTLVLEYLDGEGFGLDSKRFGLSGVFALVD